jgi:hypothetical protein
MPTEPADFDCRSAAQTLRLRFRDWVWPISIAIAVAIPYLGRSNGAYAVGSVTYYASTCGLPVFIAALFVAGFRWCWVGRLRPRAADRCERCGYPTTGLGGGDAEACCPECGARVALLRSAASRSRLRESIAGVPLVRFLLDLPGLLLMLFPIWIVVTVVLMVAGVIDAD